MDPRPWLLRRYKALSLIETTDELNSLLLWSGEYYALAAIAPEEYKNIFLDDDRTGDSKTSTGKAPPDDQFVLHVLQRFHAYAYRFFRRLMGLRTAYVEFAGTSDDPATAARARLAHDMFRVACCQTASCLHRSTGDSSTADANKDAKETQLIYEGSLHHFNREIMQCSLWTQLTNRTDPVVQTLSKALPQRCQTRDGGETTLAKFASHPEFAEVYCHWMQCSLFGLYGHSTSSIISQRLFEFFDICRTPDRKRLFYMWLLQRQDLFGIFVSREYLMYVLPQQPSLLDAVKTSFCWDRFVSLSREATAGVRAAVNRDGWAVLFTGDLFPAAVAELKTSITSRKRKRPAAATAAAAATDGAVSGTASSKTMIQPTVEQFRQTCNRWLMRDGDSWLQKAAKHKQFVQLLDDLGAIWFSIDHRTVPRNFVLMLEFVRQPPPSATPTDNPESMVKSAARKKIIRQPTNDLSILHIKQQGFTSLFYDRQQPSFWDLVFSSRGKVPPTCITEPLGIERKDLMSRGITRSHYEQLEAWIGRCLHYDDNRAMQMLTCFGMPASILSSFEQVKQMYEVRRFGRKQVANELLRCKIHNSYSYSLLHCFSFLWRNHSKFRLFDLPAHYLESQIQAIRGRHNLGPNDPIPETATTLTICVVCQHVFSLHNNHVKKHNPLEAFGFKKVTVDIRTNTMYCSRENVTAHADFKHCALRHIPLLGRVLQFEKKLWILCPQPRCGFPAIIQPDPTVTLYNEHGFGCSWCTEKHRDPVKFGNPRAKSILRPVVVKSTTATTRPTKPRGKGRKPVRA